VPTPARSSSPRCPADPQTMCRETLPAGNVCGTPTHPSLPSGRLARGVRRRRLWDGTRRWPIPCKNLVHLARAQLDVTSRRCVRISREVPQPVSQGHARRWYAVTSGRAAADTDRRRRESVTRWSIGTVLGAMQGATLLDRGAQGNLVADSGYLSAAAGLARLGASPRTCTSTVVGFYLLRLACDIRLRGHPWLGACPQQRLLAVSQPPRPVKLLPATVGNTPTFLTRSV